jgi:hypothetical protein
MSQIILGAGPDGRSVRIDLKVLLRTRFLVQAASGGGKSQTLRRLAEQIFGKVPVWIIDKEDEFPSLRPKFGYLFSGPGGETPTDPRSAELVCERLLKAKASAIFGLYSLKDPVRHEWVRIFLHALMNAPKSLWTNVVVMVDEAHRFAPEKGQGESVAKDAMIDLAVDGRKRGFCAGYFTQRLGKLSKNASAELLNRMVGKTVEDIDVDRAVDLMSVRRGDRQEFEEGIKKLKPGNFWCFGDAISSDRILVHVGGVETKHPEPGAPAPSAPPPLPEKMRALLPQLADLPKEAETKAKTEAELRLQVKRLEIQLQAALKQKPAITPAIMLPQKVVTVNKVETKTVEVPVLQPGEIKKIHAAIVHLERAIGKFDPILEAENNLRGYMDHLGKELSHATEAAENFRRPQIRTMEVLVPKPKLPVGQLPLKKSELLQAPAPPASGDVVLSRPQLAMLRGLREFNQINLDVVSRHQLAGWLGKKVSGSYLNDLSRLKTAGCVSYQGKGIALTNAGLRQAPEVELVPTSEGVFSHICAAVSGPEKAMLEVLCQKYPAWITRDELAAARGLQVSGSFLNNLSSLHTAEMVEYGDGKMVKLSDWIFVSESVGV